MRIRVDIPERRIERLLAKLDRVNGQQVFQAIELQWEDWLKGSAA